MHKLMIASFVLLVTLGVTFSQEDCQKQALDAEQILRDVLRVAHTGPPAEEKEFEKYCGSAKQGYNLMKSYSKCLQGLPRQVFSILTRNVKKIMRQYCETPQGKQVARRHLACFDNGYIAKYQKCLFRYSASMRYATKSNQTLLVPNMCCGFYSMEQCMVDTFATNGACAQSDPSLKMPKFIREFILIIFGDVFELICGNYNNLNNCMRYAPGVVEEIDKYSATARVSHRNAYFVKYLVKLSERISEN